MGDARSAILDRLRAAGKQVPPSVDTSALRTMEFEPGERLPRFRRVMTAVNTEFLTATHSDWPRVVRDFLEAEKARSVVFGPLSAVGRRLGTEWTGSTALDLVPYDRPMTELKEKLFVDVDAGITSTRGGIVETGSLIVWPTPDEPRALSLVPPMHIALLDPGQLFDTFWQAVRRGEWERRMPTNALLISGPSKTADIEQTLAYGVHGPRRLIVVVLMQE